jgi:hypothetical protein
MIATSMITTSPIYMINAYRVNNDYYRVDATRRILGGQQGNPRQPRRSSIARSAYNQAAQTKASGLSTLLKSVQNVKQSADSKGITVNTEEGSRAIANPTQFQSQMQAYLPIPEIGLLLDRFM